MNFDNYILCTARNGQTNSFRYHLKESDLYENKGWTFMIVPENLEYSDWYEFGVTEVDANNAKITMMSHKYNPLYVEKGISEKMIEEASIVLNRTIHSSSNNPNHKSFEPEWRSESATKVWKRLENLNLASYNNDTDTFTFLN